MVCKRPKSARFHILIVAFAPSHPELTKFPLDNWNREYTQSICAPSIALVSPPFRSNILIEPLMHPMTTWSFDRTRNDDTAFAPVGIELIFLPSVGSCIINTHSCSPPEAHEPVTRKSLDKTPNKGKGQSVFPCPWIVRRRLFSFNSGSHIFNVSSMEMLAKWPFLRTLRETTGSVCPSSVQISSFWSKSHNLIVLSSDPLASHPFGKIANEYTWSVWPLSW